MQKRNDNCFRFEILCPLIKKITLKFAAEKNDIFVFVFVLFCVLPKHLKFPSGLTKLCNFVNKDYLYYLKVKFNIKYFKS